LLSQARQLPHMICAGCTYRGVRDSGADVSANGLTL